MYITFLVGNGFDISAGVDTSYNGFYHWYCDQPSETDDIAMLKQEIKADISGEGKNWSDLEMGLGKYTSNFSDKTVNKFVASYKDCHASMITYLKEKEKEFDIQEITMADMDQRRQDILSFYQELSSHERDVFQKIINTNLAENVIVQFISFNYTNILDNYVEQLSKAAIMQWTKGISYSARIDPTVVHVHGFIEKFPILGINDSSQVANNELLDCYGISEMMIKDKSIKVIGEPWQTMAIDRIDNSQIICILGMSLGPSDKMWWEHIMGWLGGLHNRHLVLFWHMKNPPNNIFVLDKFNTENMIKDKITSYANIPTDKLNELRSRIHIIINTTKVLQIPKNSSTK